MKKNNEKLKYSYHSLDETDKKLWWFNSKERKNMKKKLLNCSWQIRI